MRAGNKPRRSRKASARPIWRAKKHTLYLGNTVVKAFKQPAPIQELILASFQEQGWPERIDDPLPGGGGVKPKVRLHDAIKRLNLHQHGGPFRIHFWGEASGTALGWEVVRTRRR